jgi:hypothetical protein
MTSRAADFAVLGQAGFLAAGLTTVFCNAVGKYGCGQSCFIGNDGWDHEVHHEPGIPLAGPYHGVLPGIYRPYTTGRGWLGQKEEAMVIADIDPVFSFEGRPRPQMLPPPLQLVAHLPLIQSWKAKRPHEIDTASCRCAGMQPRNREEISSLFELFQRVVLSGRRSGYENTVRDGNPDEVAKLLDALANFGEPKGWLRERSNAYRAEHSANPQYWLPPVAADWLWVDLGTPGTTDYPIIEVPRYTTAPGEAANGRL